MTNRPRQNDQYSIYSRYYRSRDITVYMSNESLIRRNMYTDRSGVVEFGTCIMYIPYYYRGLV